MQELILECSREESSFALGFKIGQLLDSGDVLALWGDLGAGKTFLTRAIARGLGVPAGIPVTSPTFTFINEYDGRVRLYHLDLYRIGDLDELDTLPWREALFGEGVAVVEWPERLDRLIPSERWDIRIAVTGDESRRMTIAAHGENNRKRLKKWRDELTGAMMNAE